MAAGTPVIKGDSTIIWGCEGQASGVSGIVVSVTDQLTGEEKQIKDENGFTAALVLFDTQNKMQCEVIVKTSFPALVRGDTVNIGGRANCIVQEATKTWASGTEAKYSVTAVKFSGF